MITDKLIGNQDELWVCTQNDGTRTEGVKVYTDDPQVLTVSYVGSGPGDRWYDAYTRWQVKVVGCGTAHVLIEFAGEIVDTFTVSAPEYPKSVLRFEWVYDRSGPYAVGACNYIDMLFEGNEMPRVYTDNPDVVEIKTTNHAIPGTGGRVRGYRFKTTMIGAGTANIICELEGETLHVFPVTVAAEP